jgi:hypothetical protein
MGTIMENPFTYGNPISNPARFIGRRREVEQVFSRLRNAEAESTSIMGERRVGKTSLLHYLMNKDVRAHYGVESDRYIFVYSDLQMVDANTTPVRFSQRLLHQIGLQTQDVGLKQMIDAARSQEVIDNFVMADLFDEVDAKNLHVVLLLDEFEKVTGNPNFGPDFFYGLRSLAIQHNLTLITSSRSELIELTHSEAIRSSPFFNIFANINVRLFSEAEAHELVTSALTGTGIQFTDKELFQIFSFAGYHPFFLQAACYFLFDAYTQDLSPEEREQYLLQHYRQEVAPHLDDYWRNSPDNEKIVLTALALLERDGKAGKHTFSLAQLQELYARSDQTLGRLEKRSLLVNRDDGYTLFNLALGEWVIREISDTMNDPLNYEDWLKNNQGALERLSKGARQELGEILPRIASSYRDLLIGWVSDPRNLVAVVGLLRTVLV